MAQVKKATLNGFEMAYADEGQGEAILLIHGFPFDHTQWDPQIEAFSRNYRVISPDLRGHGQSQATPGPYPMDLFAADLARLLDHLTVEKVILGGLSMGGYIAFAFLRKYPQMVKALILADTRAQADTPEGAKGREDAARRAETVGTKALIEGLLPKLLTAKTHESRVEIVAQVRAMMERCSPIGWAAAQRGMAQRPDSTELLPMINPGTVHGPRLPGKEPQEVKDICPTLIIVGKEDTLTPPDDSRHMHSLIPGSRLEVIPGAAHVTTLEQPEAFNQALSSFLAEIN